MQSKKSNTLRLTLFGLFTAIILVMWWSPLGYFAAGAVEITLLPIPVVIGAILLGPPAGAFFGFLFGLTSFLQCFGIGYMPSPFGAALLGINPIATAVMCFIPRILMGLLVALIFKGISKIDKTGFISFAVSSLSGAVLNTAFFMAALMIFFGNSEFIVGIRAGASLFAFFAAFIGINGLIEGLTCFFIGGAVSKALSAAFKKQLTSI